MDNAHYVDELLDNTSHRLRDSIYEIRCEARRQDQAQVILSLLALGSTLEQKHRQNLVDEIGQWVIREIVLGRLAEQQIVSLLAAQRLDENAHTRQPIIPWRICTSIWEGMKMSSITRPSIVAENTIDLLLKVALRDPNDNCRLQLAKEVLTTLGRTHQKRASHLLSKNFQLILNNRQAAVPPTFRVGRFAVRYEMLSKFLKDLPLETCSETVAKATSTLVHDLRRSKSRDFDKRREWLATWLSALHHDGLLRTARQDKNWETMWQETERELSKMDSVILGTYLRAFTDREACAFIVDYLVCTWHVPRLAKVARSQQPQSEVLDLKQLVSKAFRLDLASNDLQYVRLLISTDAVCPHLTARLLRVLYPILFELKRPDVVWTISRYCYSRCLTITELSLELLFAEVARWTKTEPTFALRLLLLDKRPEAGLCPSIPQALEEAQDCPTDVLLKLLNLFIRAYGVRHKSHRKDWTRTRFPVTKYSSTILHVVASRIASQPDLRPSLAWRRVRRLFRLFRDTPDYFRKEMAVSLTQAGIVNSLKEGRKVPEWRMQWIGHWVRELEGAEVWKNTEAQARNWWREVELQEGLAQRVWRPGHGWMPRKSEVGGGLPHLLIRRVARRKGRVHEAVDRLGWYVHKSL